jgi:hypothetical protein
MTYSKGLGIIHFLNNHYMPRVGLFLLFVFALLTPRFGFSQASLVPVYHEVYDWLHYQRVLGNAPLYNYEALPLTRGEITTLLISIDPDNISGSDSRTRHSYLREFSIDSLRTQDSYTLLQGPDKVQERLQNGLFSQNIEPHIYVWSNEISTVAVDLFTTLSSSFVEDGNENFNSPFYMASALRTYGTISNIAGVHYEQYTIGSSSNTQTFQYIPFFGRNAKYLLNQDNMNHFEGFAGFHKDFWSFHIGRGLLKYGVGKSNNLVYSREGIPFDWLRFNINTKHFKYSLIHGFLTWSPSQVQIEGFDLLYSKTSPSRYTVHQRIQFQPAHWISFGYYDLVNYSNREFEITYLNPVNRLAIMEFEQDDQDNGFVGFEGNLRPIPGLEIYGEMLVDDLRTTGDLFRWNKRDGDIDDFKSSFARHLGATYALKSGQVLNINYQRVDPSVYAHRFELNSHSEEGFGLGSQIGPNGDELSFNFDQWFSQRSRISAGYTINRHGLNYFDSEGNFVDTGGGINDSYTIDPMTGQLIKATNFLQDNVHEWNTAYLEFVYEPWTAIKFKADITIRNITKGTQLEDLTVINFGVTIGE